MDTRSALHHRYLPGDLSRSLFIARFRLIVALNVDENAPSAAVATSDPSVEKPVPATDTTPTDQGPEESAAPSNTTGMLASLF
jgi:hypothetical protein